MSYTIVPANGTSSQITKLDSTPPVRLTAGEQGLVKTLTIRTTVTVPINMPTTNFLPLIRFPTNSVVQSVKLILDAAPSTSLTGSVGLVFSDAPVAVPPGDGTQSQYASTYGLTGASPSVVSMSCFLYETNIVGYVGSWTDITFGNYSGNSVTDGYYVPSASMQPIWQALTVGGTGGTGKATAGSSPSAFVSCVTDPFGFFDLVWFETTTGVNTSTVQMTAELTISGEVI